MGGNSDPGRNGVWRVSSARNRRTSARRSASRNHPQSSLCRSRNQSHPFRKTERLSKVPQARRAKPRSEASGDMGDTFAAAVPHVSPNAPQRSIRTFSVAVIPGRGSGTRRQCIDPGSFPSSMKGEPELIARLTVTGLVFPDTESPFAQGIGLGHDHVDEIGKADAERPPEQDLSPLRCCPAEILCLGPT